MPEEQVPLKDREIPFIKPSECPGKVIETTRSDMLQLKNEMREVIKEELKPMGKFMTITTNNQTVIYLGTVIRVILFGIIFFLLASLVNGS